MTQPSWVDVGLAAVNCVQIIGLSYIAVLTASLHRKSNGGP